MRFLTILFLVLLSSALAYADQFENAKEAFQQHESQQALKLLRPFAERGYPEAQFDIGWLYEHGEGVKQDKTEAYKWYRKVREEAEDGEPHAQRMLGDMYHYGVAGVKRDEEKAEHWWHKALSLWQSSADEGNADAQLALGSMYALGKGVKKDRIEAANWYRKAAEQGNAEGQDYLGKMYKGGLGGKQEWAEALKWFRKAAEQGNADAQWSVATMYERGEGVKQDYTEAMKWYHKAADQGNPYARTRLADVGDIRKLRMAAEQGNAEAQSYLGFAYSKGEGVKQDNSEAVRWYRKAADQGDQNAQWNVGQMYKNGLGVKQDNEQAYFWELAAEKSNLGYSYSPDHEYYAKQLTPEHISAIKRRLADWNPTPAPAKTETK
jgi:uncharacterized protein